MRVLEILGIFRHTKGKFYGKQFDLFPWQSFLFAYIFGLKHRSSHLRVVRKVLLNMAKKGGKSEIGGALGVIMTFFDGEHGAECYSVANKYDQALFSWEAARKILQQLAKESPAVASRLKIYDSTNTRSLLDVETDSFFKPIATDAKTLDGVNPHLGLVDEYHAAVSDDIPNNLESGMVAREQPLLCIITTRGFNSQGPLRRLEDNYGAILEGKMKNDSVLPLIFSLDEDDDWQDESVWEKANPGIGRAPSLEGLREEYSKAITEGASREVNFRTKNMNEWTNVESVWIQDSLIKAHATDYAADDLEGRLCFSGIDLATNRDIAASSFLFPPISDGEGWKHITRYYIPEENIEDRSRRDRVPYLQWLADGWLTATPGNTIDYDYIEQDMYAMADQYDLQGVYYDRFNAKKVIPQLIAAGLRCEPFAQIASAYWPSVKEMERMITAGDFDVGRDPVIRWMFGNVVLRYNTHGYAMPDKQRSREKIDGVVAMLMALAAFLDGKKGDDPYDGVDFESLRWI